MAHGALRLPDLARHRWIFTPTSAHAECPVRALATSDAALAERRPHSAAGL